MEADFSRWTFDPTKYFARVLRQQGRVALDADWNEQAAILLHAVERLTRHVIGEHGAPRGEDGFRIGKPAQGDFAIGAGVYYAGGVACEMRKPASYRTQPYLPNPPPLPKPPYLVYLDVWEQHLTHLQDVEPREGSMREVALGGSDTATRTRLVWQVRAHKSADVSSAARARTWVRRLGTLNRGGLQARANGGFRGIENWLYRVEIHDGGGRTATFKWSRENGSAVFPIMDESPGGYRVTLGDHRAPLAAGDWVEFVSGDTLAHGSARPALAKVTSIDESAGTVTLANPPSVGFDRRRHPLLRRWDGSSGLAAVNEGAWLPLEEGVAVRFAPPAAKADPAWYRPGDYWLIAARPAIGDVEWPRLHGPDGDYERDPAGNPKPAIVAPHGVEHRHAPLAYVPGGRAGVQDLRALFRPLARSVDP